jgi:Tol biopolymer transport system component
MRTPVRYILLPLALATLACLPSSAAATWPGKASKLAYHSGGGDARTVDSNGKHRHVLAKDNGVYGLDWSRSGKQIVFADGYLWRARADGSHKRKVFTSNNVPTIQSPSWSPDGRSLVFTSETDSNDDEHPAPSKFWLYTIRVDGTHFRKLVEGREAVWSASGRHIRFSEADGDVAQVEPDGSHYKVLAHHTGFTHSLDLSPDGKHLVYITASFTGEDSIIEVLNVRTRKRTSFPATPPRAFEVAWAPGGKRLVYGYHEIDAPRAVLRTMRTDGTRIRRVFTLAASDGIPSNIAWQTR